MERKIILASHSQLAAGMKATLGFFTSDIADVIAFTAYDDNEPIDGKIKSLIQGFSPETELIVFTDVSSGSVNQQFMRYLDRPHFQLISGMNLPLVMGFALLPTDQYIDTDQIDKLVAEAREQLVYVNAKVAATTLDDDDE